MMKKILRIFPLLLVLAMIAAMLAPAAGATADPTEASPPANETTASTAPPTVKIQNFYLIGSNNKYYLCSPEMTDSVDSYSFNIPDWMESATILIKAATGLSITSDSITFEENSGVYKGKVKDITKASQSYSVSLSGSSASRKLTITIRRSNIPCYFDSISMYKGDTAVNSKGTITDGLSFNLDTGTTSGVKLRIKPRHEDKVTVSNLTGLEESEINDSTPKTTLDLNTTAMRYDYSPTLVEGTNIFRITVSAGTVVKTCDVTIIVGDANANAPTTESTTAATQPVSDSNVAGDLDFITTPTTTAEESGGGLFGKNGKMSPVMWVIIGIIITIIAGAIIFMIVNLSNHRDDYYDDYDDYDGYGYDRGPVRPSRRNLAEYVDDDDYYDDPRPVYRSREEYDERYGDGYSYDDTYDGYSSRSQYRGEGRRPRGGDYYDDDYDY